MSFIRYAFMSLALLVILTTPQSASPQQLPFSILYTSDEHSALIPHSPVADGNTGGFARLAGTINHIRSQLNEPSLLVSAGDFTAGTVFTWLALDGHAPELKLMADMGYDIITIGNHEFDYGPDILAQYLQTAGYPDQKLPILLASNTDIPPGHPLADCGLATYELITLNNGLVIGVFGLLGSDAIRVTADPDPITFSDQHETAQTIVTDLKQQGAQVIIAVNHSGVTQDRALARSVSGIDIIIGGHCHTPVDKPIIEGETIIVQSGPHTQYLGLLQLSYCPQTDQVTIDNEARGYQYLYPIDADSPSDPDVAYRVDHYISLADAMLSELTRGQFDSILQIAATSSFEINRARNQESTLGNFITDAMHYKARSLNLPVDITIQANGQIRSDLVPGKQNQLLTTYDLIKTIGLGYGPDLNPGYPLVHVYLTGDEIRRVLEISPLLSGLLGDSYYLQSSGLRYTYDPNRSVLMWIPFVNLPLPSYKGVLTAETDTGYPLNWGDDELYAVVTDYYVASFVPQVGDMLPRLAIEPKDETGTPVADLSDRIVYDNGREVKVWQAVLAYVDSMDRNADGIPVLNSTYEVVAERQRVVQAVSLRLIYGGAAAFALILIIGLIWFIRRSLRQRQLSTKA